MVIEIRLRRVAKPAASRRPHVTPPSRHAAILPRNILQQLVAEMID